MVSSSKVIDPLRELLDAVTTRLAVLEDHCGITSNAPSSPMKSPSKKDLLQKTPSSRHISGDSLESPAVKAFDTYTNTFVYKFADTCDDLEMGTISKEIVTFFEGMRYVVVLASLSKQPSDMTELASHLKPITEPMGEIKKLRLSRDFDNHHKAISEMLACCSWVTCRPPAQLPAAFVKECIGSSDFWSNRIRKEFKGKDDEKSKLQLAFCDNLKATIVELSNYISEHHKTGLTFNPKGVSLAESAIRMTDNPLQDAAVAASRKKDQQTGKKDRDIGNTVKGGNMLGLVSELANRRSGDGSSAATGLRKVTKDQQTWRKEFKGDVNSKVLTSPKSPSFAKKPVKKKKVGLPILEYQQRGTKWVIENHDKETAKAISDTGILEIEIADPKQQVYIYNCEQVTIKIKGTKFKSVIVDKCIKVNVILPTVISGCELVNSKKIAVQSDGVCPVFTIDKTVGVSIYLSKESAAVSSFTTSMSSEMNVSIPDGDDYKEMPIPEQFFHKFENGALTSEVSDLYG
jgi:adenylyl cyclase-associated protein